MAAKRKKLAARRLGTMEEEIAEMLPLRIDGSRVRLYEPGCSSTAGALRRLVLRASGNRAIALGNHVFLPHACQRDMAVLAHELTHCAQYQRWGPLRYFARGLVAQLRHLLNRRFGVGRNPYHYQQKPGKPFEAYGMEQQAQMVEDWFRSRSVDQAMPSA